MASTRIEFAVQMTCQNCAEAVKKSFDNVEGIKNVEINLKTGTVVVDTRLSTDEVQKLFEKSGKKAVVKGYAGQQAAVSILDTGVPSVKGVVRFVQLSNTCIVDGTVDGLQQGLYQLNVHECGDVSQGCASVGDCYQPADFFNTNRIYGDIGRIKADSNGRAAFRLEDNVIQVSDLIGRSLVLLEYNTKKRLVCGVIARSSGLFQNPKMICACDGVSIWDERAPPKAGL